MRKFLAVIRLTCLAACLAASLTAAPLGLPEARIPDCWGVNIHFIRPPVGEVDRIAKAGFRFVRMDVIWPGVEKEKGKYDFSEYDLLVKALEEKSIRMLFILNTGNAIYHETMFPRTPEAWRAYAAFTGACAAHYKDRGILWEIWNEPDNQYWSPSPSPEQYARMAKLARRAIKHADPDALVVGPAMSQFWYPFLEPCIAAGLLDAVDVVSIHPYWSAPVPEQVIGHWEKTRKLISERGGSHPMISGEWGYTTADMSEEAQAQNLVRSCLTNLLCGIRLSIWYDWWDDGPDPRNREHNFGVIHGKSPKKSYIASQTMTTVLNGCRFEERLAGKDDEFILLLKGARGYRLAAWTTGVPREVVIPCAAREVSVVTMLGDRSTVAARGGRLTLGISNAPVYVEMGNKISEM